jgi:hypothetical protein
VPEGGPAFGVSARADVMNYRRFPPSLLAAAIGLCALTAGEQSRPSGSADPEKAAQKMREEKQARLLADLGDRLKKMLDMQNAVHDGTKALHKVIQDTPDKKPRPEDEEAARKLAATETDIINAATKAIDKLEAEEPEVAAFAEVFRSVRKDMELLRDRLKKGDVGTDTQAAERDIIETFKDMISALKDR